jgi:indolepyruvate ferredoxin oxidoreductase beta subunit
MPHDTSAIADVTTSGTHVEIEGTKTILLVGVGGQGTILAGNILAMTAA